MRTKFNSLAYGLVLAACADTGAEPELHTKPVPSPVTAAASLERAAAGSGADSALGLGAGLADVVAPPTLHWERTERIGQLTGGTTNPYPSGLDLNGTDLGMSFQRGDKLYFLFGDAWSPLFPLIAPNQELDPVGWTSAARPAGVPKLNWLRRSQRGAFLALALPEYKPMKIMSVPVEGIAIDDVNYIFFYNSHGKNGESSPPIRSILAHTVDPVPGGEPNFAKLEVDHAEASKRFQSVSAIRDGKYVWVFGAGPYRDSLVYLARAPVETFAKRETWEYYQALDKFAPGEGNAKPVFDGSDEQHQPCVGELSVRKHPSKALYFMAYNCGQKSTDPFNRIPLYVQLRAAHSPQGPWSAPVTIMTTQPGHEAGYIKKQSNDGRGEAHLNIYPDRQQGDIYGPYLIPSWFRDGAAGEIELVYTLSTWNPYQVQLMKTTITQSHAESP